MGVFSIQYKLGYLTLLGNEDHQIIQNFPCIMSWARISLSQFMAVHISSVTRKYNTDSEQFPGNSGSVQFRLEVLWSIIQLVLHMLVSTKMILKLTKTRKYVKGVKKIIIKQNNEDDSPSKYTNRKEVVNSLEIYDTYQEIGEKHTTNLHLLRNIS